MNRGPIPVGIDLGTTNCAVAYLGPDGRTRMVPNAWGEILTPSAVFFGRDEIRIGREAVRMSLIDPNAVAISPKRDLGMAHARGRIHGRQVPPELLQGCLLRGLKESIRTIPGWDRPAECMAVVSVPAYFDEVRRQATLQATIMADLPTLDLVAEPVAAALAFGEYHGYLTPSGAPQEHLRLLVYDLGGGTFDVTLLELSPGHVRTIGTDGDAALGGLDWDRRLADYLAQKFESRFRIDPRDDPLFMARLWQQSREARESLSTRQAVIVPLEFGGGRREVALTLDQFEALTADLFERTFQTVNELLRTCRTDWHAIDRILLTGGASRMPRIEHELRRLSRKSPDRTVSPDEAVARGAAIHAAYRLGQASGDAPRLRVEVVDVASLTIGIEGVDPITGRRQNQRVIPRNTVLPATCVVPFVTLKEDQRGLTLKVLHGESDDPTECVTICHAILDALPPGLPKGSPITLVFEMPRNGELDIYFAVPGGSDRVALELRRETTLPGALAARWQSVLRGPGRFADLQQLLIDQGESGAGS